MSKHIVVGDLHIKTEENFEKIQKPFFDWLIELYGDKDYILDFEGDVLDTRKVSNNMVLKKTVELFDMLETKFKEINIIVGNHDVVTAHSVFNNNILEKLFRHNKNIDVISRIKIKDEVIFFPYCFKDTKEYKAVLDIENKKDYIIIGHFEHQDLYGDSEFVIEEKLTKKFKYCMGGHWHQPWKKGNFCYTGTPFELMQNPNGAEYNRGVYIFDTEYFSPEFVVYPEYRNYYLYTVKSDADFEKIKELAKDIKEKNIKILIERNYKLQSKKNIEENLKKIEKDNYIKIETFEEENILDEEKEILKGVSIFSSSELKETIFKFIDIKYIQEDKKEMKVFVNSLLEEYREEI